jgi:putative transposase
MEVFDNVSAAKRLTAAWKDEYNHRRPHSSLGYRTPVALATDWTASTPDVALPPFQQPNPLLLNQPQVS